MDTAIIVGVVMGSVVAMVLIFAKTVLGVAWTGKGRISEDSNVKGVTGRLVSIDSPKGETHSTQTPSETS